MRARTATLRTALTTLTALATLAGTSQAASVYVFSTGNATVDAAYASTLAAQGHTVTIGRPWSTFDGSVDLSPFDAVLMNKGANWGGSATIPVDLKKNQQQMPILLYQSIQLKIILPTHKPILKQTKKIVL